MISYLGPLRDGDYDEPQDSQALGAKLRRCSIVQAKIQISILAALGDDRRHSQGM